MEADVRQTGFLEDELKVAANVVKVEGRTAFLTIGPSSGNFGGIKTLDMKRSQFIKRKIAKTRDYMVFYYALIPPQCNFPDVRAMNL